MDGARALQRSRDLPIKTRVVTRRKRVESELPAAKGFYQRFGKRAFDATFSLIFLIAVGSWLYPLVALAIRLDSRGPVLFRPQRVGLHGQVFTCLEFRTMVREPAADFCQAHKSDAPYPSRGSLLRRHKTGTIPQSVKVHTG